MGFSYSFTYLYRLGFVLEFESCPQDRINYVGLRVSGRFRPPDGDDVRHKNLVQRKTETQN